MMETTPHRTIGRLNRYGLTSCDLLSDNTSRIYSHSFAGKVRVTAARVRRNLMPVDYTSAPTFLYNVNKLDVFVEASIRGVMNLARTLPRMPESVHPYEIDSAMSSDRMACFT